MSYKPHEIAAAITRARLGKAGMGDAKVLAQALAELGDSHAKLTNVIQALVERLVVLEAGLRRDSTESEQSV